MPDVSVFEKGLEQALNQLKAVSSNLPRSITKCHQNMGKLVKRTAVEYAPMSPTQSNNNKHRKTRGKTKRNPRAYSRPSPGGLMRSIKWEADENKATIFIASNSEAGKYAKMIHDGKGTKWFKRGTGTVAKGVQADEKFIERACNHHRDNGDLRRVIQAETDRCLHKR